LRDALYSIVTSLRSHQSITLARMRGASLLAKIILMLILAAGHTCNKLKASPMQTQLCAIAHR